MLGLSSEFGTKAVFNFSEAEKRQIIEDYLQSGENKQTIWEKYTGRKGEHGTILRWMYKYGYLSEPNGKRTTFVRGNQEMNKQKTNQEIESEFENLQLKRRILELEKRLQESEMKSIAYETMIEIAERELNINIKKKFNTKPSKK
jgi:transposase-like protein